MRKLLAAVTRFRAARNPRILREVQLEIANCLRRDGPDFAHHLAHYVSAYANEELFYWAPVAQWLVRETDVESVLDVGAGYGTLLLYAIRLHRPRIAVAIDPCTGPRTKNRPPYMSRTLRVRHGIVYHQLDVEQSALPEGEPFDVVLLTEVIEHFNYHPLPTLRKIASAMRPGGRLMISTPDAASWGRNHKYYRSLDDIPAFHGQQDTWIDDHIWHYEKAELESVLIDAGFHIADFDYSKGTFGRHLCYRAELRRLSF